MGNGRLVSLRGRRNAYCTSIECLKRRVKIPWGSFDVAGRVSITIDLTDNGLWRCALDLTGLRWGLLTGCYKLCNLLLLYGGREFLSHLSKFYVKRN